MKKKLAFALALVMTMGLALTACGGNNSQDGGGSAGGGSQPSNSAKGGTLTFTTGDRKSVV